MQDKVRADAPGELYQRGLVAVRQKDRVSAQSCLDALAKLPSGIAGVQLGLLQTEVLLLDGRLSEAEQVLQKTLDTVPDDLWVLHKMSVVARQRGDIGRAWDWLQAAQKQDPGGRVMVLKMQQVELLFDLGQPDQAVDALRDMLGAKPGDAWASLRLARHAEERGDTAMAIEVLKSAQQHNRPRQDILFRLVQNLVSTAAFDEAIDLLNGHLRDFGDNSEVLIRLARVSRWAGNAAQEHAAIDAGIAFDPLYPPLLHYIFSFYLTPVRADVQAETIRLLRARIAPDLKNHLKNQMLAGTLQFEALLKRLRHMAETRSSKAQALQLARALLGVNGDALGLRYLRFCLRRWPDDLSLLALYVNRGLKKGDYGELDRQLDLSAQVLPPSVILGHRFMVQAYRGDLQAAAEMYLQLEKGGQVTTAHRNRLAQLMFNTLMPEEADTHMKQLGNPIASGPEFRARFRHFGQLMTELELELENMKARGGFDSLEDWLRARPGSTVAAIRVINDWRSRKVRSGPAPEANVGSTSEIPRRIFQYWDTPRPPKEIDRNIDSWRQAAGFTHQLFDRAAALEFLRETFGPAWSRALRLAVNPAQEADYVRLCLLAQFGGVYADSDDVLIGRLDPLLGAGEQLVVYREPLGGPLGSNFIAASKQHKVLVWGARKAREALESRCNETVWSATGPGLVNRAIAHYLVAERHRQTDLGIRLLDWPEVASEIAMHTPSAYKFSRQHWNPVDPPNIQIWNSLNQRLAEQET